VVPHALPMSADVAGRDAIDELRESDEKENERDGAVDDWTERPDAENREWEGEC